MLLPLLIILLKVPPLTAVGSDAVFATFTKVGAGAVHFRQKTVDLQMAAFLALGSIPGALIGFRGLSRPRETHGPAIDEVLRALIGVLLITIPVFMLAQIRILRSRKNVKWTTRQSEPVKRLQTTLVGFVGGVLVGLTSVGSGSIILVGLLLIYRRLPAELVGTHIVHAIVLTGLTGTMHYTLLNSADLSLVMWLLAGSIPGSLIGARLSVHVPARHLQIGLLVLLLGTGLYLISY